MNHRLEITLPERLWQALHDRATTTGRTFDEVVQQTLVDGLDPGRPDGAAPCCDHDHHGVFQVSTSGALVDGLYQGAVTVGDLLTHGDLGLGTFEDLDGEMVVLDGHCYRVRGPGDVSEAAHDALTPYASVVQFSVDHTQHLQDVTSWSDLITRLDGLRDTDNDFFAWRIHGVIDRLELRAACRHDPGTPLVEAVQDQIVFTLEDTRATVVGFWSPEFAPALAIPGYHLHALTDDRSQGGHVFDLQARSLHVEAHRVADLRVVFPETDAYLEADLSPDATQALDATERPQ
jgi:acetolactate decarboxylase